MNNLDINKRQYIIFFFSWQLYDYKIYTITKAGRKKTIKIACATIIKWAEETCAVFYQSKMSDFIYCDLVFVFGRNVFFLKNNIMTDNAATEAG